MESCSKSGRPRQSSNNSSERTHGNGLERAFSYGKNFASFPQYDKEKYKEMILDAAETILGYFGFNRTAYSNIKKGRSKRWYEELREQRIRDIEAETV